MHFSFGFAPHIGQRTDSTCRNVSFAGSTIILFGIVRLKNNQLCALDFDTKGGSPRGGCQSGPGRTGPQRGTPFFSFSETTWLTEMAKLDLSRNSNLGLCLAKNSIHNPD
jgi:hypothetical protein